MTPKLREHTLGECDPVIAQNMRTQYGTAHNLRTIAILPMQSRSQKLTARNITDVPKVQLVTRTVTQGVKTPKTGI